MKVQNVRNVPGLFSVIGDCKGDVRLVSPKGDEWNLKSKISQMSALAGIFSNGHIHEMELRFNDPDDVNLMLNFLMAG